MMLLKCQCRENQNDMDKISNQLDGYSAANIVLIAQRAAKLGVLAGCKKVYNEHFVKALEESSKF